MSAVGEQQPREFECEKLLRGGNSTLAIGRILIAQGRDQCARTMTSAGLPRRWVARLATRDPISYVGPA